MRFSMQYASEFGGSVPRAGSRGYGEWATRNRVPMGFMLGVAFVIFAQPTPPWLVTGAALALIGLAIRAWAAGCLDKNANLATGGPYAWTRNPLYLGSLLIGSGFALAGRSLILGIAFLALFLLVYQPVIRQEENFLRATFGELYARYAEDVPLLWPHRPSCGTGELPPGPGQDLMTARNHKGQGSAGPTRQSAFRWGRYRKNHEYEAAAGYAAGVLFLILKMALR